MKKILIIHGFQATSQSHWFQWLKNNIQQLNYVCDIVELTDSAQPIQSKWHHDLSEAMSELDQETIVIAHSLGCISVLDYLSNFLDDKNKIKAFIGVSGFVEKLKALPELNEFIQNCHLNDAKLRLNIKQRYVMFSNNDHYVPAPHTIKLGQILNAQMFEIKNAGHFLESDGFSEFPQLWDRLKVIMMD